MFYFIERKNDEKIEAAGPWMDAWNLKEKDYRNFVGRALSPLKWRWEDFRMVVRCHLLMGAA